LLPKNQNQNVDKKAKFWRNCEVVAKKPNLGQKTKSFFRQNFAFWPTLRFLGKKVCFLGKKVCFLAKT